MDQEHEVCAQCHQRDTCHPTTADCACLVCENCANTFMEERRCGVCNAILYDMLKD